MIHIKLKFANSKFQNTLISIKIINLTMILEGGEIHAT